MLPGQLRLVAGKCKNIIPTVLQSTTKRNSNANKKNSRSGYNTINQLIIYGAMGLILSTAAHLLKLNLVKRPSIFTDTYLTGDRSEDVKRKCIDIIPRVVAAETNSLRERFNFIDRVAKDCLDAVVFIEIADLNRIDPLTAEPIVLSTGSGFFVRDDGWILTNAHVVVNKAAAEVRVRLKDGNVYRTTIEDVDFNLDLALLKVQRISLAEAGMMFNQNDSRRFPAVKLGNSADVAVGEWVVALGSPLSLSHSVTAGVVSSISRESEDLGLGSRSIRYIQTDASITFGNSGGPLVNLDGYVIGINNLRITAGISFAIPIDYAKRFIDGSVMSQRKYLDGNEIGDGVSGIDSSRSTEIVLGIATITLSPSILKQLVFDQSLTKELNLKELDEGVLVYKILDNSVGQRSGLKVGDIITRVNGFPVTAANEIYTECRSTSTASKHNIEIEVLRKGERRRIALQE